MKLFTKNVLRNLALAMLGASALSACGGVGSCANCNTTSSANLMLSSSTVALDPTYVQQIIVITNTGNAPATNLVLPILSSPVYLVSSTCTAGMTLAPQETCSYTISYIGAPSSSSENVIFGYSGGSSSTVPLVISWASGYPIAYITNNGGAQDAGIWKCSMDTNGDISSCNHQGAHTFPATTRGLAFAVVNGVKYLYVTISDAGVSKCSLDQYGQITTCDDTAGVAVDNAPNFSEAGYIQFAMINGVQYVYIGDTGSDNVYVCTLDSNGDFASCSETLDLDSMGQLSISNINGRTYLYIASSYPAGILRYAINESSGLLGSEELVQASNADYSAGTGVAYDGGLNIVTLNGINYVYSGSTMPTAPSSGNASGGVSTCSLDTSGIAVSCNQDYASGAWTPLPYSINNNVAEDLNLYVYFGLYNGQNGMYKCGVNTATGALLNCAQQNILNGGEPYSIAFAIYNQLS
ncbi:MAG: hypothetical protein K2Y14_10585 [Burkholderiales bacterium]|nr:hypothetical protein [Burkholderiales bacterium]